MHFEHSVKRFAFYPARGMTLNRPVFFFSQPTFYKQNLFELMIDTMITKSIKSLNLYTLYSTVKNDRKESF